VFGIKEKFLNGSLINHKYQMKHFFNYSEQDVHLKISPVDKSVMVLPVNSDDIMFFSQHAIGKHSANNKLKVLNVDEFGMMHLGWVASAYKITTN
jgi:hypothetical protein